MYKLTNSDDVVINLDTQAFIPRGHRWWDEYEAWKADGNVPEPAEQPEVVIVEVTMRQARLQLLEMGLLQQVDAAIASLPGVEGEVARIEWEFAATVNRDNPTAQAIMNMLQFTSEQIDAFFLGASEKL